MTFEAKNNNWPKSTTVAMSKQPNRETKMDHQLITPTANKENKQQQDARMAAQPSAKLFTPPSGDLNKDAQGLRTPLRLSSNSLSGQDASTEPTISDMSLSSTDIVVVVATDLETDDNDEELGGATDDGDHHHNATSPQHTTLMHDLMWLSICFAGIMASFVAYGILLEYTTSDGRRLHELSVLFVISVLGTITAWIGRTVKKETIADIPSNRFVMLGFMSLGSTFCAIRALRYVIFPIQVLARSCKPVPVLLIGTLLGKKYPRRKYVSVFFVVVGVALFMGFGNSFSESDSSDDASSDLAANNTTGASVDVTADEGDDDDTIALHHQIFGVALLIASLFFDGGTGAYEDKLMSMHHVEPFDLMFKFQLSKAVLSAIMLVLFNQIHLFVDMLRQTGAYILALGLCSAIGQVFIFITIAKFGALTASLMSLTRKVTTLTASIVIYNHDLTGIQFVGLLIAFGAMLMNFIRPKEPTECSADANAQKVAYASVPTTAVDTDHSGEINAKRDNVL